MRSQPYIVQVVLHKIFLDILKINQMISNYFEPSTLVRKLIHRIAKVL